MTTREGKETVFLVDDDVSVLRATARLLKSAGWHVEAFPSAESFLDHQRAGAAQVPGCVVLDITMPGMNGLDLQKLIGSRRSIVFLTGTGDIPMSVQAMKSGAVNFLSKPCHDENLLAAVEEAVDLDREWRRERDEERALKERFALLTPREYDVMLRVSSGLLNKQIAGELEISEKTVKVHRARVMEKLQITSVAALVRLTEAAGLRG